MTEFEPLPTIEEAAMMAAGIRPDDDSQGSEGLVILPHQLPRPVWIPPSPPAAIEPFYQPVDGKPVGKSASRILGTRDFTIYDGDVNETVTSKYNFALSRVACG